MESGTVASMGAAVGVGGLAGIASALRSGEKVSARMVITAALTSTTTTAIVWWGLESSVSDPGMLLAVSSLAGAGGAAVADLMVAAITRAVSRWLEPPNRQP